MKAPSRLVVIAALAAAGGLAVGAAVGRWAASPPAADRDVRPALAHADEAIRRQDWQAAHDALLVALRVSPGGEDVFDAACRFVEAARGGDGDAALLAQAVHQRLDAAVPYQPLDRVPPARDRVTLLGDRLYRADLPGPKAPAADHAFAAVDELLRAAGDRAVPLAARVRLAQEAEGELAAAARRAVGGPAADWAAYEERKARHDAYQKGLAADLYRATLVETRRIDGWRESVRAFVKLCDEAAPEPRRADPDAARLVGEGQRVLRELVTFRDADVPEAATVLSGGEIDHDLARVVRARDWVYNRWAVAHIAAVDRAADLRDPLARLRSLAAVDEARLVPYVSEVFAARWKHWFDECGSADDKLAATKARILRGAMP